VEPNKKVEESEVEESKAPISVAIQRLLDEVRDPGFKDLSAYNRIHTRHNRS